MTSEHPPSRTNISLLTRRMREQVWLLAERWRELAHAATPPGSAAAHAIADPLRRFGEIPAFLAALARHLERPDGAQPLDEPLRTAALEHARARIEAGYDQRALLAELTALRPVLWEHLASSGLDPADVLGLQQAASLALDAVLVEVATHFVHELTSELVHRAEHDPLTGLHNRQAFHDRLERELARAERFDRELTVVSIDLDAFKQVNDTLGHLAGDAVLQRLGTLLSTHTREQDIVARLGGDEFAVGLVEANVAVAQELIRRVRIHLVPARRQFGLPREFGISAGAATFPHDGVTVEQLLFHADGGLYRSKGAGRGSGLERAGHAPRVAPVRVLVVDDDAALRSLCRATLEQQGFEVTEAGDGRDGLTQARADRPDVLLLDLAMPGLDGWQVLEHLRRDASTSDVPVVLLTGRTEPETIDRAVRAGVVDFLDKPFDPDALVASVHHAIEVADEAAARSHALH